MWASSIAISDPVIDALAGVAPDLGWSGIALTHPSGEFVDAMPSRAVELRGAAVADRAVDHAEDAVCSLRRIATLAL